MFQKSMFDRYYCIETFSHSKTWRKYLEKFFFPVPIMARKATLPANVFKTPLPGQRLTSCWRHEITFATVHVTGDDISFCDGPGMLIPKTAKPCINSTWIALLIHGFVPVKTSLLIACDTALYAIILILTWRHCFSNWTYKKHHHDQTAIIHVTNVVRVCDVACNHLLISTSTAK